MMSDEPPARDRQAGSSDGDRVDRLAVVIAFLVATVSIISAVVAGRAAVWSSTASDIDSLVLQESIEREQLESNLTTSAAADLRLAARYDAAQSHAVGSQRRADELRATDPAAAARADLDAQAAWGVNLALWPFFRVTYPSYDTDGALVFDALKAASAAAAADARLTELRASRTPGRAAEARTHTLTLVGVAVLFVAALFALTIAEVGRGRARLAPLLVALGLAVGATAVTILVEPETAQLIMGIVAVAAVAIVLALLALERRNRTETRAAGSDDPAPPPDSEGGAARLRGGVAVVLAATTLLGAGVGYLQSQASDAGVAATREAQDQALLALAEHQRTMAWATAQVEVWSMVEEARAGAIGARQAATYLAASGDAAEADAATAAAEREDRIAAAADRLTVLGDEHPDGPRADPAFPSRFLLAQQAIRTARIARQDLANEANAVWGGQVAAYVAVLATLAIAAYLLGLSLVLRTRRLRGLFALTGLCLVGTAAGAAGLTALAPAAIPSVTQRAAIAAAYARASLLDDTAVTHADHVRAVAAWREVVALHPTLARARVRLASELFAEGSPQTTGYSSIATLDATRAALAELEAAAALGWDDLGTRGDAGFFRFLVGLADPASDASARAVLDARAALELAPGLPILRYNLAVALLADGRLDEARAAYDAAIAAARAVGGDGVPLFSVGEVVEVSSGALTDIELVTAARADRPEVLAAIGAIRAAIVEGMDDRPPTASPGPAASPGLAGSPEAGSSPGTAASTASVSDLQLLWTPSELWWQARIDGFDPEHDRLSVVWLQEDPAVPGWHVLARHSGPLRLGQVTWAGGFYENGAAPDYFASQGYLMTSDPSSCVPDGRYRVELYLDGTLATEPVVAEVDAPELTTERRTDLGLVFCRPDAWTAGAAEPGRALRFQDEDGTTVLLVDRTFRPDPDSDAGAAEVRAVMDGVAHGWDASAAPVADETVPTSFMGLDHAQVQWYDGVAGRLKVFAGATDLGTVLSVALAGTPEWVDGEEASGIGYSFLLQ